MISWVRNGVEYPLDTGRYAYHLEDANFGMPPVRRLTEKRALQMGATDVGYTVESRLIQLVLGIFAESREEFYERRGELIEMFAPTDKSGKLRWQLGDKIRDIDCHFAGGLDFPGSDRKGYFQKVGISLQAPDPTWYDPAGEAYSLGLGGGGVGTPIPMIVPTPVGASNANAVLGIAYAGTAPTNPHLLRLTGPITDGVIYQESTGRKLDFTGTALATGEYLDIDTRPGGGVKDQSGMDRIELLSSDSDLAAWQLRPRLELGGNNSIRVTGSGITDQSYLHISFMTRYLGI